MKEILERVLKALPGYLPDLGSLVTGPKAAILRWVEEAQGDLSRPLMFVAISVGIGFLIQLPQIGKEHDFTTMVIGMSVFKILALVLFAAVIHLLFRIVGGGGSFSATLSAYLYIVSPLYIVLVILETAKVGVVRAYDPALATAERLDPNSLFTESERMQAFSQLAPDLALAYVVLSFAGFIALIAWPAACWGALRRLHGVGRWRSTVAGAAALAAALVFFPALQYLLLGMFGTRVPVLR